MLRRIVIALLSAMAVNLQAGLLDTVQYVSLLFVGDMMQHKGQLEAAQRADGSYDYTECFDWIAPEVARADLAFANLEVTLSGLKPTGYPCFSAPDSYLYAIRDAGFDVLFTANNHCCDKGLRGVCRTIEMCDSLGLTHLGTYHNEEERAHSYPLLLHRNGISIAMLNFTYGTNGISTPQPTVVNRLDTAQIRQDILKAQSMHPDVIIAVPHWGIEYETLPRRSMVQLTQWLFDQGVDFVVGGHPHVVQPIEVREDPIVPAVKHLVAYSLGNFISDMSRPITYGGMMLRLELSKDVRTGRITLIHSGYQLTFVSRPQWSGHRTHWVYPVNVPDSLLNAVERHKRDEFLRAIRPLFAEHNIAINEY